MKQWNNESMKLRDTWRSIESFTFHFVLRLWVLGQVQREELVYDESDSGAVRGAVTYTGPLILNQRGMDSIFLRLWDKN